MSSQGLGIIQFESHMLFNVLFKTVQIIFPPTTELFTYIYIDLHFR